MEAKAIPSKPSSHQTTQQNHVPPFSLDATMRSLPPSPQRIDRSPWTRRKIRHAILISRFSSKIHNDKVEGSGGDLELQSRIRYFRSIKRSQMGRVDATRSSRYAQQWWCSLVELLPVVLTLPLLHPRNDRRRGPTRQ